MDSSFNSRIFFPLILLCTMALSNGIKAQDTLTMSDGEIRTGDIVKLTELKIYWVTAEGDTLSSPAEKVHHFNIAGERVDMAPRQQMLSEAFKSRYNTKNQEKWPAPKAKNYIRFNVFNLFFRNIDISYERRILNGFLGIRVPLYYGYQLSKPANAERYKNFGTGLDVHLYLPINEDFHLFGGLGFEHGEMRTPAFNSFAVLSAGPSNEAEFTRDVPYIAFTLNGGVTTSINEHFALSFELDIGTRSETFGEVGQFLRLGSSSFTRQPYGRFCLGIGYTF